MRLGGADVARARDIIAAIRATPPSNLRAIDEILAQIMDLVRADAAGMYDLTIDEALRTDVVRMVGAAERAEVQRLLDRYVADSDGAVGAYTVSRVEARQRNRAVILPSLPDLVTALRGSNREATARRLGYDSRNCEARARSIEWSIDRCYEPSGWAGPQLRVLICDGPALIAWVGVTRAEPFGPRERALLGKLIPELHSLCVRRRLFGSALVRGAAFEALSEWYAAPALLVSASGHVLHANSAAQADLRAHAELARDALRAFLRDTKLPPHVAIAPLGRDTSQRHYLIATRSPDHLTGRVTMAAQRWSLTPREKEVLALILRGASNFSIANVLECAEKTIETHVSRILRKAEATTRAELASFVWQLPAG